MEEEVIEVVDEKDIEDELSVSDYVFIGVIIIAACAIIAFVLKQIRKTFKNVHLKIGNKVEIGVETKEEK